MKRREILRLTGVVTAASIGGRTSMGETSSEKNQGSDEGHQPWKELR